MEPDGALIPFSTEVDVPLYPIRHGVKLPIFRAFVLWSRSNLLQVACIRPFENDFDNGEDSGTSDGGDIGGKVVEVKLGASDPHISEAQKRRIAYGSVSPFAFLQGRKNALTLMSRMSSSSVGDWWQHVLEYSRSILELLENRNPPSRSAIEDPRIVVKPANEPTNLKAAWQLMEMFYVDKHSFSWLPECLVDWLAEYDCILSETEVTIHSKLFKLQEKLVNLQVIEDDPEYWEALSSALTVGWLDAVVKLLRLHGSYQLNQIDSRETENGLVEAVAVLVSTMPRLRHYLPTGKLGQCYKTKPDFIKAWEKWRGQITKLGCSAFWVHCGHRQTREGLQNLLQIMLGNIRSISNASFHWMELFISHILYIRPLTTSFEEMHRLAQKCLQLKSSGVSNVLTRLIVGVLGENIEVVIAECSRSFGPWMITHSLELLAADSNRNEILLSERYNLGGISIVELHRIVYAQDLFSHSLTSQIAPTYLASCPKQGLGLLEISLSRQPVQNYKLILKDLEICRLYEIDKICSFVKKIAGMHQWKHGRKGSGIYWLQKAGNVSMLNQIVQQLFDCIGSSNTNETFKQWEGLIELLGPDVGTGGGLGFLHSCYRYRDFKNSLRQVQHGRDTDAARHSVELLIQLLKSPTAQRLWLPLLHDSVKLLNWKDLPLLNAAETNLLLSKLQALSMSQLLPPDLAQLDLSPPTLASIRLALAKNLSRSFLEE